MSRPLSLLEELGLDQDTLVWHQLARCKGMEPHQIGDPDLFFEEYENDQETAKAMDEVCLGCPVMKDCLMSARDNKDYGLRGAVFLSNGKPDNNANRHKTPEVWDRIRERLQ